MVVLFHWLRITQIGLSLLTITIRHEKLILQGLGVQLDNRSSMLLTLALWQIMAIGHVALYLYRLTFSIGFTNYYL